MAGLCAWLPCTCTAVLQLTGAVHMLVRMHAYQVQASQVRQTAGGSEEGL